MTVTFEIKENIWEVLDNCFKTGEVFQTHQQLNAGSSNYGQNELFIDSQLGYRAPQIIKGPWNLDPNKDFFIRDQDFNSQAKVKFVDAGDRADGSSKNLGLEIQTAWSGFQYTVTPKNKQVAGYHKGYFDTVRYCEVRYEGAYKGLLNQNLLPLMTPTNLESEIIFSSLGKMTMKEYKIYRFEIGIDQKLKAKASRL